MTRVLFLLSLLFIIVSSRGIPTKTCDVTSLGDLIKLQTEVDLARIACEGELFSGYECSRYWMLNNDLIRRKLSFAWCKADKRQTFRNWAGTSTVVGEFQKDYLVTLQNELKEYQELHALLIVQHNTSMELVLKEAKATLQLLENTVNEESEKIRSNTNKEHINVASFDTLEETESRTLVSVSANEERVLVNQQETNNREKSIEIASNLREFTSALAKELRDWDQDKEQEIRVYQQARQDETRDLVSNNHESIRTEVINQTQTTQSLWFLETNTASARVIAEKSNDRLATETKDTEEETSSRDLVRSTDSSNIDFDAKEESQTRSDSSNAHETDTNTTISTISKKEEATVANYTESSNYLGNEYTDGAAGTQTTWTSAASSILSLLAVLEGGIGLPFQTIAIHLSLIQNHYRNYPAVNVYTDNLANFMELRAVVNETLTYNAAKYGSISNIRTAQSRFNSAEQELKKAKPDYRDAVKYYSNAYVYATTPNTGTN